MHPILLCGKSISEFSKGHSVHFTDDPKNQLSESGGDVINNFEGRSKTEKCLGGGLGENSFHYTQYVALKSSFLSR